MRILARVKVEIVEQVFSACEDHGNIKTECESGFEIDATPSPILSVSEIGDDKLGSAYIRNDLIVDFAQVRLPIYSQGPVSSRFDGRLKALGEDWVHFLVEPHSHKCL